MPIPINQSLGQNEDRSRSVDKIVRAMSLNASLTEMPEILRYNLLFHAKRFENKLFEKSNTETEYHQFIAEEEAIIRANLEREIAKQREEAEENMVLQAEFLPLNFNLRPNEWRCFYSGAVRDAVINTIVKDVYWNIKLPKKFILGLRLGITAIEKIAYRDSGSKVEYFEMLARRKMEIISALMEYLKSENEEYRHI